MSSPLHKAHQTARGHTLRDRAAADMFGQRAAPRLNMTAGPASSTAGGNILQGMGTQRGVDTNEAYSLMAQWVYVCVNAIAQRAAAQPLVAAIHNVPQAGQAGSPAQRTKAQQAAHRRKMRAAPQAKQAAADEYEILATHEVLTMLAQPNVVQGKAEFVSMLVYNLLLTGEAYIVGGAVQRGQGRKAEQALEAWAMPTSMIEPGHAAGPFSSYNLVTPEGKKFPLDPACVHRMYFPHPGDLKKCLSPLAAMLLAARTDDRIQSSQYDAFAQGIFPNLVITVGRARGPDGKLTDRRPTLSGANRRQITRAIRQIWNDTVGRGDPAILDGLIESIHKLQLTPQEMDWMQSGEQVKKRILQTFRVNPIVLGEVTAGNRAQAVEAEKNFISQAVNPLIVQISDAFTDFFAPWWEDELLAIWLELCVPMDEDLRMAQWNTARRNRDVSRNEYRTEILGLAPSEGQERTPLMEYIGGVTAALSIMTSRGQGLITADQAQATFQLFFELPEEQASRLAATSDPALIAPMSAPAPKLPAPPERQPGEPPSPEGGEEPAGPEQEESQEASYFDSLCKHLAEAWHRSDLAALALEAGRTVGQQTTGPQTPGRDGA